LGKLVLAGGILLAAGVASPARAEVSILTDAPGRSPRLLVLPETHQGKTLYWKAVRPGVESRYLLNPQGDRLGDGAPYTGTRPGSRQPWVVWSANDGSDQEIAFAFWTGGRWEGPRLLERADNGLDDLDPRVAFDAAGNPVVTWWRNEPVPRVYLSTNRNGIWSTPLALSDPSTPSRYPSLRIQDGKAVLTIRTPRGQSILYQNLSDIVIDGGPLDGPVPPPDQDPFPDPGAGVHTPVNCGSNCSEIILVRPTTVEGGN
jgi:hypothetical protein